MVIFKQYGEMRTCTNYLKRLLLLNFSNIKVYSSELGWKHGLYHTQNCYSSFQAKSHVEWLDKNTVNDIVFSVDGHELPHSYEHYYNDIGQLNYILTYKPIAGWIYSIKKFRYNNKSWNEIDIESLCNRYYYNYDKWLKLLPNVYVINSINLMEDESRKKILTYLANKFSLSFKYNEIKNEMREVKASTDVGLLYGCKFTNHSLYTEKKYLSIIPPDILNNINNIKWRNISIEKKLNQLMSTIN